MKEGEGGIFEPMTFLIAGGSGFIGQHLCEWLLDRGHVVISWDRYLTGNGHSCDGRKGFIRERTDISRKGNCWLADDVHYILHFASHVSPRDFLKHPEETLISNSLGTLNLLDLAAEKKARFLFSSSARVYRGEIPTDERAVYEQAKRFGEALTMTRARAGLVDGRIVRMFQTYGPGCRIDDGHVIPTFIRQALKNEKISLLGGGQWTSFTYIDDMVEGISSVLFSNVQEPVDLGSNMQERIDLLAKRIVSMTGSSSIIDSQQFVVSDERLANLSTALGLGWRPKTTIDEGLKKTIEYFKGVANGRVGK